MENLNKEDIIECEQRLSKCSFGLSDESVCNSDNKNKKIVVDTSDNVCVSDKIVCSNQALSFGEFNTPSNFKNIHIRNCQNVHIGNVTNIHGPIYINELNQTINQNIFINTENLTKTFPIVSRRTWLAQPPVDPNDVIYFTETPKFVIICHSASEEAYAQTDNNLLVRLIQQFHVESRKWNDISYNFLVGADGSIYEGRGWKTVGAHTMSYNHSSIGICFIGCYNKILPPAPVLEKVKKFIKYGVEIGAISQDYSLLGHCQCRSSASPGERLFDEIQSWERWDGSVDFYNPAPVIS